MSWFVFFNHLSINYVCHYICFKMLCMEDMFYCDGESVFVLHKPLMKMKIADSMISKHFRRILKRLYPISAL